MAKNSSCLLLACLFGWTVSARADILRWDNNHVIPGTEGITPGPGAQLDHRQLEYARLSQLDLTASRLDFSDLNSADFESSVLTNADLTGANLTNAQFTETTLTNANLTEANLAYAFLGLSTLTNANLTGAVVVGADFEYTTGMTAAQLYSTKSYQDKNLSEIQLQVNDLTDWDFREQDLTNAAFDGSTLLGANLTGAVVYGASFRGTLGFTASQLYSTKSYQDKNLVGIGLGGDLNGWDFQEQNLTGARLDGTNLTDANLAGANLTGAQFDSSTLTNANLAGANLTNAHFLYSTLTNANFTGAVVLGASFYFTNGMTAAQLYSTNSYQDKNLSGIQLGAIDLRGWDFHEQDLTNAAFDGSTLTNANLTGANLARASFSSSSLVGADLRGAKALSLAYANSQNAILPNGRVGGLVLARGDTLLVRDDDGVPVPAPQSWLAPRDPIRVAIQAQMRMSYGGILELSFDADPWGSVISFQPGIPVQLGGTLALNFSAEVDLSSQLGRTLHIFDWTGVSPSGQFQVASPYSWDLSHLYSTGEITLLSVVFGDMTGDGSVDAADAGVMFGNWGGIGEGDLNVDGIVDAADAGFMFEHWTGDNVPHSVPEPSKMLLGMLGAAALGLRRCSRGIRLVM